MAYEIGRIKYDLGLASVFRILDKINNPDHDKVDTFFSVDLGRERECDLKVLLIGSVGGDGMILRMWTRATKELELAETLIGPLLK